MAATVLINRLTGTGGSETETDITSGATRASTSDAPSPGSSDPIPIPSGADNYSFWVTTRLEATATPTGTIDNIRWFSDTVSFGTDVTVVGADASTSTDAGYRIAVGTQGTTGTELTQGNHSGLDAAVVNVTTLTSGAPRTMGGSIDNPSTGRFGDHFVYQFQIGSGAGAGATPSNTFTWQYDET
jgi:hypothetical protein